MSIRRNLPEPGAPTDGPPPPSYNAALQSPPGRQDSTRTTHAGAFSQRPQSAALPSSSSSTSNAYPYQQDGYAARPHSMASPGPVAASRSAYAPPQGPPPQQRHSYQHQQQQQQPSGFQQEYQQQHPPQSPQKQASLSRSNTREDPLSVLKRYDTSLLIDDSASMGALWGEAEMALAGIVETVIRYDSDGIDIHFLNNPYSATGMREVGQVRELFQSVLPVGESTPTEVRVEEIVGAYVELCERAKKNGNQMPKPLNLLVLTDGEADDPDTLVDVLTGFARRMDNINAPRTQLGVQFVQIGSDPTATAALQQLDDELQGVRDMVDTTPYQGQISSDFLVKVALGSINRRIDKQYNPQ